MNKNGPVNFVVHKIHAKNHPATVAEMLARMGYRHEQISEIFIEAGKSIDTLHQELVEGNDFLPPLNSHLDRYFKKENLEIFKATIIEEEIIQVRNFTLPNFPKTINHKFVTRHSFVLKLFYAISLAVLGIAAGYIAIKLIEPNHVFINQLQLSYWQDKTRTPAFIILALLAFFFVVHVFYIFIKRLHDAGMNRGLSIFLFLPILPFVIKLSEFDALTLLVMTLIPTTSLFLITLLTPSHPDRNVV